MKRLTLLMLLFGMLTLFLAAEQIDIGDYQNGIRLVQSQADHIVMELTLGNFNRDPVQINGQTWYHLDLKKGGLTLESGMPQLPVLAGSVIIPNTARMELNLIHSEYVDINMPVAPSKGNLTRDIDPATVPYSFDSFYQGDQAWPQQSAQLSEPFIIRDYRGITVRFVPFSYFPDTATLRVFTKIQVAITNTGNDFTNSLVTPKTSYSPEFSGIYENMFLNFGDAKYPSLDEEGRILVIKHNMFDAAIIPWVEWKRQNGYRVDIADVTEAGSTANNIKTFIQNQYNLNDGLMFVQIMGDAPQVPTLSSGGGGSDPSYTLLAGNDNYPDIYIGRFSAQTVPEMEIQVQKVIFYERDAAPGDDWAQKGMGIASNEGGGGQGDNGESDQQHMEIIRTKLLGYGYLTIDQMYQTQGATAAQVSANLNQGRGFINYVGHGSDTSWVTTGFSNTHVNQLTNDYKLPFIVSVACVNGNFVSQTCFAEAWLRAKNNATGAPTGAVAMYGSSVNQSWAPPMRAQDEVTDLLVVDAKKTIGGLFFNGSSKMTEVYGTNGASEFKNWHIFGDASMMARTKNPMPITADYLPILFLGMTSLDVDTVPNARVSLYADGILYGHGITNANGQGTINLDILPEEPMDLTLTITAFNYQTYISTIQVLPSEGPYLIVTDMIVSDDNDNQAEYGETVNVSFELNNVGTGDATGVIMNLSSSSPYLNITSAQDIVGFIPAETANFVTNGFTIQIAANAPDQHLAPLSLLITLDNGDVFTYTRNLSINAPNLVWGALNIDDFLGNNDGRVDPGETVNLRFPINNIGASQADDLSTILIINDVYHVADPVQTDFAAVPPGGSVNMEYTVTFSSQIPVGTVVHITTMVFSGEYSVINTYSVNVGLVMENFENGFENFPWTFTGGAWNIVPGSFNGSQMAKSAATNHNQSTSMSVTMNCAQPGEIAFWKKVSSEQNYDFFKFYINGTLKEQSSGTNFEWSRSTYPTQAGMNTFKWEYVKDSAISSGFDCVWVDDIEFPVTGDAVGSPRIILDTEILDFGTIFVDETLQLPFTINNEGDAVLIGEIHTNTPFSIINGAGESINSMHVIIQPDSYLTFNVRFSPTSEGTFDGVLSIQSDDTDNPIISVALTGQADAVSNDDPILPVITELRDNYPNPFNPSTTILYSVKDAAPVNISIYNLKGQLIKTLVNEQKAAGNHSVVWNGDDSHGRPVSSGIYLYKMSTGKFSSTKRMVMMK